MFTGIVEAVGVVAALDHSESGVRIRVTDTQICADARIGDSIAVNGVCLTITELDDAEFCCDVMSETLRCSALDELGVGAIVNLERPMRADGRFDGHIVQGHVDGVGIVRSISEPADDRLITIAIPIALSRYIVEKGSITVDGISFTIVDVADDTLSIAVIPHTWTATNLSAKSVGSHVNLEVDVIAKYVERLVAASRVGR